MSQHRLLDLILKHSWINAIEGLSITLSDEIIHTLNDIWPGMGGEAPEAYAW